jgi:hypothetical protein
LNLLRFVIATAAAPPLRLHPCSTNGPREVFVTRTFGAAIGALIFVFFMSYIATRLMHPVSAEPVAPPIAVSQR